MTGRGGRRPAAREAPAAAARPGSGPEAARKTRRWSTGETDETDETDENEETDE
ncbi:hypothetical protein [Streptomyces johnsoniae]|uniref:Uncharacterized protein n=1 Tax=Streptomyces johnsoniae TaxID=3075532 RepID=A0ABU2S3X2_9ACTN|nr:hypothetical protein [Streptomyces sp. DSM 41886]MDT0442745.1 hypothetical protein [Streptomyces sp. DSM 41886]